MKKILTSLAALAVLASTASADFARVEMGAGAWMQTPSGTLSYEDNGATGTYTSDEKEASNMYAWLLVKHPIPVLPNIRLEYVSLDDDGKATGNFKGFSVPTGSTNATLNMKQYDIIPYYNILDNTFWMTVDLGLDIKVIDLEYSAEDVNIAGFSLATENYSDSTTVVVPLAYVRARVQIPVTNIGFEADVKYITYGASTVSDIRVKADYTLGFIPVVQPAIEVGYRIQSIQLQTDDKKTNMNMDYSGVYAGLMVRF